MYLAIIEYRLALDQISQRMKCLSLFLLTVAVTPAVDFTTGQAARAVIGQPTFTAQQTGASDVLVGGVSGLAFAKDTLYVADANRVGAGPINNRVLIFQGVSNFLPSPTSELRSLERCPVCKGRATLVLGQPDFTKTDYSISQTGLRLPTAVASDGNVMAVADTDNNRVLIYFTIPTRSGTPADVVVGQPDFKSNATAIPPTATSLRGPQGVWIYGGKLYIADTQNNRVLIYNSIPTANGVTADVVLGQKDFNTFVQSNLAEAPADAKPDNLLNPVSVTSDGLRLYVSDLGHNRVLIWNTIPTSNQAPADLVIGQPDMNGGLYNNSKKMCAPSGKDDKGNPYYPTLCAATLSFPRFALSDRQRLFIADGGNDRVLVYNSVPTRNGQAADRILGQRNDQVDEASESTDSLRTPTSLAWDGSNLYVSDSFNRRILVYSPADISLPSSAVRNAASFEVFAVGTINFSGSMKENDEVTVKIQAKEYKYKVAKDDKFENLVNGLVSAINAGSGDPNVFVSSNPVVQGLVLTARSAGEAGNDVTYSVSTSSGASVTAMSSGTKLQGGQSAAKIAPGTLVTIKGTNLSDGTDVARPGADRLPTELAGTQLYFDGVRAPLLYVSPTQINAQLPFELSDTTSSTAFVRTVHKDHSVTVSTAVAVNIVPNNPGIFASPGNDPRPAVMLHGSSYASGSIAVNGSVKAGDVATVSIEDRSYSYTVKSDDKLASVRDNLIIAINKDPKVVASAAGVFTRIRIRAKARGPQGNGIKFSVKVSSGAQLLLNPSGAALCCAADENARVTNESPATPGEVVTVYATGLGLTNPDTGVITGIPFNGPDNQPNEFVSALAGGKTANVLFAGLQKGQVGRYEVQLELNSDLLTNPFTQLTLAQNIYVSNIVTFPVVKPK